jgi:hypothetical protein
MYRGLFAGLVVMAVFSASASGATVFFDGFEGPYIDPNTSLPYVLPEGLNTLDPAWTNGGLAGPSGYGATGQLIVDATKGSGPSNGAWEGPGGGYRGNNHAVPGGPISSGTVIYEADLLFTGTTVFQNLGTGSFANLVLSQDNGPGFIPIINFQAGDNGEFQLEAGSLGNVGGPGGLPSNHVVLGTSSGAGRNFHLTLTVNLTAQTLLASVSGDSSFSAGPYTYTSSFAPGNMSIVAGRFGNVSGTSWDNISLTSIPVPEPTSLAAVGIGSLAFMRRRRTA